MPPDARKREKEKNKVYPNQERKTKDKIYYKNLGCRTGAKNLFGGPGRQLKKTRWTEKKKVRGGGQ